jgi:hypothetical protein
MGLSDLIIAIDLSEDGPRVIALVGAREHIVKSRFFSRLCTGLRHFRRVGSDRKSSYLRFFIRRYSKIRGYLEMARIFLPADELISYINTLSHKVAIAIVDDKLYNKINIEHKISEGSPKPTYMENLVVVADNLANYFRIVLRDDPKKFREELRRFEK